jgi:hypothetical protein
VGFSDAALDASSPKGLIYNPKGIASSSPGLRGTSYPGLINESWANPNGVATSVAAAQADSFGTSAQKDVCSSK